MTRIIIIEDERFTANDLKETITRIDNEYQVVAILQSVKLAIDYLNQNDDYDLIFSDIQLSDGLCFEIFRSTQIQKPIIFCTAYDQYALNAFKSNGIGYLLKPFNTSTVANALAKYNTLRCNFNSSRINYEEIYESSKPKETAQTISILADRADKIIPLDITQIALFYLNQRHVYAYTFDNMQYVVNQKLTDLSKQCGNSFFRVNRQYLVNRKSIKSISRLLNRKYLLNLCVTFNNEITVGKLKISSFKNWIAQN